MKILNKITKQILMTYEDLECANLVDKCAGKIGANYYDTIEGEAQLENGEIVKIYSHWSSDSGIDIFKNHEDWISNKSMGKVIFQEGVGYKAVVHEN